MTHRSAGSDKARTDHVPHDSVWPTVRRTRVVRIGPGRAGRATAARAVPGSDHRQPIRQTRLNRAPESEPSTSMIDLSGTHGVIVGVANKRSLAWAIAQAMDAVGAQLTLSYATERFEGNVRKLGATLRQPPLIVPCDVTSDAQVRDLFRGRRARVRRARLSRARGGIRVARGALRAVSPDVTRGFPASVRHQRLLARRAGTRGGAPDGATGRRQHSHADLPGQPARVPELQRDGGGQGRARGGRPVSGE